DVRELHSFPTRRSSDLRSGLASCGSHPGRWVLRSAENKPKGDSHKGMSFRRKRIARLVESRIRGGAKGRGQLINRSNIRIRLQRSEEHTSELQSPDHLV